MKALVLTDIQNDFLPGGALAVPEGNAIVPLANQLQPHFPLVLATQDWHPPNHGSFASNHRGKKVYDQIELHGLPQTLWPVHCVENTYGAQLAAALSKEHIAKVFHKGVEPSIDSYSALFDNGHLRSTGLGEWLKTQNATELYFCGLATDYCVKFSALDAVHFGFKVYIIEDACRGINLKPHDVDNAIKEIKQAGVVVVQSRDMAG